MNYPYDITFITINYNGFAETAELIGSLCQVVRSVSYEVIVVDNHSLHEEGRRLQEAFPQVQQPVEKVVVREDVKPLGLVFTSGNWPATATSYSPAASYAAPRDRLEGPEGAR